jgi:threonine synthase
MDILISSNLERFLFEISGHQEEIIIDWMKDLQEKGQFRLANDRKEKMEEIIFAGYASEAETMETIKTVYHDFHYLVDPHTAVGLKVFRDFQNSTGKTNKTVIDATASPFKFNRSVLDALLGEKSVQNKDELTLLQELSRHTGLSIPTIFRDLKDKTIRNHLVYNKENARQSLFDLLRIK